MNNTTKISVVIPVYNDEAVLLELCRRLWIVLDTLQLPYEVLLIDDGSRDNSASLLERLALQYPFLTAILLTRNFGQFNAIRCGLENTSGELIIIMDSDLQDRPEDIPLLLKALETNGTDMAIAQWSSRKDSFFKLLGSKLFNLVVNKITNVHYLPRLGVFRIIKRKVIEQLIHIPERSASLLSLMYWAGFTYVPVPMERDARFAGNSSYSIPRMMLVASNVIFPHSFQPLRFISFFGIFTVLLGLLMAISLLIKHFAFSDQVAGWLVLINVVVVLFGITFCFLGLVAEYLGRAYEETKGRPKYVINRVLKSGTNA